MMHKKMLKDQPSELCKRVRKKNVILLLLQVDVPITVQHYSCCRHPPPLLDTQSIPQAKLIYLKSAGVMSFLVLQLLIMSIVILVSLYS